MFGQLANINLVKLCTKSLTVYGRDKYLFAQRLEHISYLKIEWNLKIISQNIKNRKQRVTFTKLRLSDHNLLIEEGRRRRTRIPREQRLCPLCSQEVENEIHFLITCDTYTERFDLFNQLSTTVPVLFNLDNISKLTFLMSQEGIMTTKLLVSQVSKMTEERMRLIQQ